MGGLRWKRKVTTQRITKKRKIRKTVVQDEETKTKKAEKIIKETKIKAVINFVADDREIG